MSQLSTPPKKNESTINPPKKNRCEKSPSFSHVPTGRFLSTTFFRWPRIHAAWSSGRRRLAAWNVWRIQLLGDDWLLVAPWLVGLDHFLWLSRKFPYTWSRNGQTSWFLKDFLGRWSRNGCHILHVWYIYLHDWEIYVGQMLVNIP